VILTADGGAFGRHAGPKQGAISRAQGEESWKLWKAGTYGDVILADGRRLRLIHVRQGHAAASSPSAGGRGLS
jgi:hypothetical protein